MRIAFIGIDGCGKSTILELLSNDKDFEKYKMLWCRYKPYFLRAFYKAYNHGDYDTGKVPSKDVIESNYNKSKGLKQKIFKYAFMRWLWLKITYFDYRYSFKRNFKTIQNKEDVLFDRYFFDLYVDQCLNFGYSPEKISNLIKKHLKAFPKLDRVIYVRILPELSLQRKNDIPNIEYLNKRFEVYEYLSKELSWDVVDASQPIEVEMKTIKSLIL